MPARLTLLPAAQLAASLQRIDDDTADEADLRALTKHLLAVLTVRAPGSSVEVRIPPFAVAQCIAGPRHTRGTPSAVVEMSPADWVAVGTGRTSWADLVADGRVSASGERSDLSGLLPLV